VRPPDPARPTPESLGPEARQRLVERLTALTAVHGVTHTGVAPADVMHRARSALHHRIDHGLTDGMQFTFKNPERSTDPRSAVRGARAVFVAARPYLMDEPERPGGPVGRVARYAWLDHYAPLRAALWEVADHLRSEGWKAVPFADDNSIVDREVAHLAGIGWFGKNANLLLPGAGSWFALGCVVTTAPLPVAATTVADGCGSCRRCLDGCPTGAIVAPGVIDGARCIAWVLQKPGIVPRSMRAAIGDRLYGCDDCQEVCPPAVRFGPKHPASSGVEPPRAWVAVLDLLAGSDAEVLEAWGRWYLADRDPRWVRRNALVVLGNVDPDSVDADAGVRIAAVLADYVAHRDPVLRAHAVWAAQRLGLHHLVPRTDPHPEVRAELEAT
jgi:epoxyqueuosine reductase